MAKSKKVAKATKLAEPEVRRSRRITTRISPALILAHQPSGRPDRSSSYT